jgi:hypothetical protein
LEYVEKHSLLSNILPIINILSTKTRGITFIKNVDEMKGKEINN